MFALLKFLAYIVSGSNLKVTYILSYKVFICQKEIITVKNPSHANTSTKVEVFSFSTGSASTEQRTFEVPHTDHILVF